MNLVEIEKVLALCYGHVRGLSYRSLRRFCKKENLKVKCTDDELNVMVSKYSEEVSMKEVNIYFISKIIQYNHMMSIL